MKPDDEEQVEKGSTCMCVCIRIWPVCEEVNVERRRIKSYLTEPLKRALESDLPSFLLLEREKTLCIKQRSGCMMITPPFN